MRLLVIDDSPPTRALLQDSCEEAGHEVTVASRFSTGLKFALEREFDAILLDLVLPDGSGLEICRELRREGVDTPILMLTARGEVGDRIAGLDAGADDYLAKPFAVGELQARLRALARRRGLAPPAQLSWHGASLSFTARQFQKAGKEIPLTAREWAVLDLLASRLGRVVPREELLDSIWGETSDAASESLDVIVSRLRRKLTTSGGAECLRTIRGIGYAFEPPR